jgi:hypothetical protein
MEQYYESIKRYLYTHIIDMMKRILFGLLAVLAILLWLRKGETKETANLMAPSVYAG